MTLSETFTFASVIQFGEKYPKDARFVTLIFYPILAATFFLHFYADATPRYVDISGELI